MHNNPLHHIRNELDDRVLFAVKAPSDQTTTVYVDGQKIAKCYLSNFIILNEP